MEDIRRDSAIPIMVLAPSNWTTLDEQWKSLEKLYDGKGKLDRSKFMHKLREFATVHNVAFVDLTDDFRNAYAEGKSPHWKKDGHLDPPWS